MCAWSTRCRVCGEEGHCGIGFRTHRFSKAQEELYNKNKEEHEIEVFGEVVHVYSTVDHLNTLVHSPYLRLLRITK